MRLPDFKLDSGLNGLKSLMGIAVEEYGDYQPTQITSGLTLDELKKLESGEGVEIELDDLTQLPDGTIGFKERRVLLYIRDKHIYNNRSVEDNYPKYHFFNCKTLVYMMNNQRFHRYKVAAEMTGIFQINFFRDGQKSTSKVPLRPCAYCLRELNHAGFRLLNGDAREKYISEFKPVHFFELKPKVHSFTHLPLSTEMTSPIDNYTNIWTEISTALKDQCGWKCMNPDCGLNLSGPHKSFLQAHHINGNRSDNSNRNLIALCIECHSNQPMHAHIRNLAEYKEFIRIFGTLEKRKMKPL
jgi:hypothetical protein